MSVGTYCYVAVGRRGRLGGARRFGAHRGRRGAGHIVAAARLQLVNIAIAIFSIVNTVFSVAEALQYFFFKTGIVIGIANTF